MTEYRALLDGNTSNEEPNLVDLNLTQNANPFGDSATLFITDHSGQRISEYQEGRQVDVQAREFGSGNSFETKLAGYVVESRVRTEAAGDMVEVELYALDTLLRRNDMNGDLSGQTLRNALKDLIQNYTAVDWNSGNDVTIVSNQQVNRPFTHERVDNIIEQFRLMSGNEEFGVDENLNFYFRPAETKTVRTIGRGDWNEYDFPERASESVNQVTVYFDEGDKAITVDDRTRKSELEDSLGASEKVVQSQTIMRENITDHTEARRAGERALVDRSPVQMAVVETFGLLDAGPGDVIPINIPQAGVNADFTIAQLEYEFDDRVTVTAIRREEQQQKSQDPHSDMLVRVSDDLQRVEMRPATSSGELEENIFAIETLSQANITVSGNVDGVNIVDASVTNVGFEVLRDALIDTSTLSSFDIDVGTGNTEPSRTTDDLDSISESVSASVSTGSGPTATFTASPTTSDDIQEVLLSENNVNGLMRAVLDEPVSGPNSVELTVSFDDGDANDQSVLTTTGQIYLRDVFANNSPTHPDTIAVGDGTPTLTESTTNLAGTQLAKSQVGEKIYANVGSQTEWDEITTPVSSKPFYIDNGALKHAQAAFVFEAETAANTQPTRITDSAFSNGEGVNFDGGGGDVITFSFTPRYDINDAFSDVGVAVRCRENGSATTVNVSLDGDTLNLNTVPGPAWVSVDGFSRTLEADEQTFVQLNGTVSTDLDIDLIAVYDKSRIPDPSTWDNTVSSGELDDPQLYADQTAVELNQVLLDREKDTIEVNSDWNDTSNGQEINIGTDNILGTLFTNTEDATTTLGQSTDNVVVTLTLSAFDDQSGTPAKKNTGQQVNSITVKTVGGTTRVAISGGRRRVHYEADIDNALISSATVSELALLDTNGTTLTHSTLPDIFIEPGLSLAIRDTIQFRDDTPTVNAAFFDPEITDLSFVEDSDTDGQAYFSVSVISTSTSL